MIGDLVLDSSVVIAALRRVSGIEEKLDEAERLWLPIVALGELELGVELASNTRAQRSALNEFLSAVVLLPLTAESSRLYGRIKGALVRAGTPIPENDVWIAAVAMEHGWPLATRDDHFKRVPGLLMRDWR